jgi:hypothetical protein
MRGGDLMTMRGINPEEDHGKKETKAPPPPPPDKKK